MKVSEEKLNRAYDLGKVSALEGLSARFRTEAGKEFSNEKRERAELLIQLANTFKTEAEEARYQWDRKYGKVGKP